MSEQKVKKIIPSKLETGFQQFLYRTIGEHLPKNMTPNQMTGLGALFGLMGAVSAGLSAISPWFLCGTIVGLAGHLVCDDLDGFIARKRGMSSTAGGYFDLLTDILHITYLLIAMMFAHVIDYHLAAFMVPVYALIIFTAMNYIHYLGEFLFPRLGPIETHMFFVLICILGIVTKNQPTFELWGYGIRLADLVVLVGGIPMYYEMIRLQIQLFKRLDAKDRKEREEKQAEEKQAEEKPSDEKAV